MVRVGVRARVRVRERIRMRVRFGFWLAPPLLRKCWRRSKSGI